MPTNPRKSHLIGLTVAAAVAAALSGQTAVAQQANEQVLEEVVVTTARQREEALQDVPASITAITADTLEAAAVQRAGDFIRLSPGVSLVQAAEVADAQVNIRGINGARDAENSFALIIDGVLQTNPAAFNREYSDLKQIEVVKGPQGAIYGRNAAAGAIIITTTKPSDVFAGSAKVGLGQDNMTTGSVVLSGPISDTAGWKIAADYRKTDGFYRNRFLNNSSVDDYDGFNINARLVFEPTDSATLDVKARYGEVEAAAISFNPVFLVPGFVGSGLPNAQLFNEDVNKHNFEFVNNIDPFNNQESFDISAKWDQATSFGKLTAWALYSDVQNDFGSDGTSASYGFFWNEPNCVASSAQLFNSGFKMPAPQIQFGPPPAAAIWGPYTASRCDGTQYQVRNQKDYSFELRLQSDGDQRLRWLAGVYALNIDREVGVNTGIDSNVGVVRSLFVPRGQPNATEQLVWDNFTSDVYAGFANLSYDITDSIEGSLALRYDNEKRKVKNLVPVAARTAYFDYNPFDNAFVGNSPLNPALVPALNPNLRPDGTIPDRSESFSEFQPKVSLTWKASDNLTAYANWGVGFKSGGFNNTGSAATVDLFINCFTGRGQTNAAANCPGGRPGAGTLRTVIVRDNYDKETSQATEIGFKGKMADGRLSYEAALFSTKVDDMQFFEFLVGDFGLLRVVNNIDEVQIQGVELGMDFRVTDEFKFVAGYSRVASEIKKNTSRPTSVGNEAPYTADYTATIGAEFDVPVGDVWGLQASAYLNIVGPTWFHVIQSQNNETVKFFTGNFTNSERDKFQTLDARLAFVSDTWTLALVGKNITDTKFLQEVIPAPEFGGAFVHPGSERHLSLELGYKF
ncbi:MAG: TonB-dependent receptor [Gammaproteobacteria bacterium]